MDSVFEMRVEHLQIDYTLYSTELSSVLKPARLSISNSYFDSMEKSTHSHFDYSDAGPFECRRAVCTSLRYKQVVCSVATDFV